MLVLGIETSRQPGSVALRRDSRCLARATLDHDGLRHAQALPPVVAKLLQDHAHGGSGGSRVKNQLNHRKQLFVHANGGIGRIGDVFDGGARG